MFSDRAQIESKAGNGGDGITSFLHYKGVVNGGPDGGDGGKGGDIVFRADRHVNNLADYYYKINISRRTEAAANPKTCSVRREKISS